MREETSLVPNMAGVWQRLPAALTKDNRPLILGAALGIILLWVILRWISASRN